MVCGSLLKLREHGIQGRELNRMYKKKPLCSDGGQTFQPVRFRDCQILVQLLGVGCAAAATVFVAELVVHRWMNGDERRFVVANVCLN